MLSTHDFSLVQQFQKQFIIQNVFHILNPSSHSKPNSLRETDAWWGHDVIHTLGFNFQQVGIWNWYFHYFISCGWKSYVHLPAVTAVHLRLEDAIVHTFRKWQMILWSFPENICGIMWQKPKNYPFHRSQRNGSGNSNRWGTDLWVKFEGGNNNIRPTPRPLYVVEIVGSCKAAQFQSRRAGRRAAHCGRHSN